MMPPSAEEIAWAAGLFEGEGTITHSDGQLYVRLGNTDQEVIRRFADVFPFGTLYGPYERHERDGYHRKPVWVWIARAEYGLDALAMMWPWLGSRRRGRAQELTGIDFTCFVRAARELLAQERASQPPPPPAAAA
jgi:hypothetical protein